MEVKEYYSLSTEEREYWLKQIKESDWGAGQYLHYLLSNDELRKLCGASTRVYLLTENQRLVAFCTLADEDEVRDTGLTPWIGFVYTYPTFRGHRHMGILLEHAYEIAKLEKADAIYLSTGATGLYEKYGYTFYQMMKDMDGGDTRVYRREIK